MEKSAKMVTVMAVLVLAVAAATTAEARNIKTTDAAAATSKDTVLEPTTFPPFDRMGSGASPAFGGLPGSSVLPGSSIPGFSLPGSGSTGFGSMPFLGGGSPGLGGFGGMPGSPATGSVGEQAQKP